MNPIEKLADLPPKYWVAIVGGGAAIGLLLRPRVSAKADIDEKQSQEYSDAIYDTPAMTGENYGMSGLNSNPFSFDFAPVTDHIVFPDYPDYPEFPTTVTNEAPSADLNPPEPALATNLIATAPVGDGLGLAGGGLSNAGASAAAHRQVAPKGYTMGEPPKFPASLLAGASAVAHQRKRSKDGKDANGTYQGWNVAFMDTQSGGTWIRYAYRQYTSGKRKADWLRMSVL